MLSLENLKKNYLKLFLITSVIFIYIFINLASDFTQRNLVAEEISFTRYQHNCNVTVTQLEETKTRLNEVREINYAPYELELLTDPGQILCIGKIMSLEIDKDSIYASVGTSYWLFKILTLIFIYSLFLDRINLFRIFYSVNILFIKFWLGRDLTLGEYFTELIPIVVFCLVVNFLKYIKIKSLTNKASYMTKIDSLRALAVGVVIINHFDKNILPNGYLGVDIFFVISGFVITKSLFGKLDSSFINFYKNFIIKRFRRIYPVLIFIILIFLVLINFYDLRVNSTFLTGLTSLFAFSNIYLYSQSNEYFSDISSYNSFLHTWSLGVEEQFYLIFPLIYFLLIRNKKLFKIFLIAFISLSVYFFTNEYASNFSSAYYLPQFRFWEIASGSLIALLPRYRISLIQNINLLFLIGLLLLNIENNPLLHIGVVLSTSIFILLYDSNTFLDKPLKSVLVNKIGLLSYSMYLIHLPIGIMFKWLDVDLDLFSYISLILILSIFSYKYIEVPNRVNVKISTSKIAFMVIAITSIILLNPLENKDLESTSLKNESFVATFRQVPCHAPKYINALSECLSSNIDPEIVSIYLLGDSHITNHFMPLKEVLPSDNFDIELYVDFGYINYLQTGNTTCENLSCLENGTEKINTFLKDELDQNDFVVFSVARDRYVSGSSAPRKVIPEKITSLQLALVDTIENIIIPRNSTLYLIDDIPKPCIGVPINWARDVIQLGDKNICYSDSNISKEDRKPITNLFMKLAKKFKENVIYLDPHDYLCVDNNCNIIENEILLYADLSPHLTSDANFYLEAFWRDSLRYKVFK
jgi:peptidoglycan/LPS O-acetylase OafA/YrhL